MLSINKDLGQHFLHNPKILHKIVQVADLSVTDRVLEIGPGTGNLTRAILKQNIDQLHGIEKDTHFIPNLETIKQQYNDIFTYSIADATQINFQHYKSYNKLIANLAYNIVGHLLKIWIMEPSIFSLYVITIQREMADRIMANPHNKTYGKLSIMMQVQFHLHRVLNINPASFFPIPKVRGTTLLLKPKKHNISSAIITKLMSLLDLVFSSRRKKIHNLLRQSHSINDCQILQDQGFDLQQRPENFSPDQFVHMAQILLKHTTAQHY